MDFKRSIIVSRFGETIKAALSDLFSCDFDLIVLAGDEINDFVSKKKEENSLPEMAGYTFDRFIVGNSNKFAHAAAVAVAERPGKTYNPLFIYGNSGLGKTHLLLAIGQAIHEREPNRKIAYVKGDEFTIQLVKSIKDGTAEEFRTKYRNVDGTYSAKTWQSIKGYWYYFYSTGYMATNAQLGEYYVDKSGHMVKNKIVKIGKYYYRYGADGRFVKRSKTRSKLIPKKKHSKRHLSD